VHPAMLLGWYMCTLLCSSGGYLFRRLSLGWVSLPWVILSGVLYRVCSSGVLYPGILLGCVSHRFASRVCISHRCASRVCITWVCSSGVYNLVCSSGGYSSLCVIPGWVFLTVCYSRVWVVLLLYARVWVVLPVICPGVDSSHRGLSSRV